MAKRRIVVEEVVAVAIARVDRDGPDALTLRGLAEELGVGAMSLYHWFDGRDALVRACAHHLVHDAVRGAPPWPDGPSALAWFAHTIRRLGHQHPHWFGTIARLGFDDPQAAALAERLIARLLADGLAPAQAFARFSLVRNYAFGATAFEVALPAGAVWDLGPHPTLALVFGALGDPDRAFADGLALAIGQPHPPEFEGT